LTFAFSVLGKSILGDRWYAWGTWTNAIGDTGGSIITGLSQIEVAHLTQTGSAVSSNAPVVNSSFPIASGTFIIVTDAGVDGVWSAIGYI